MQLNIKDNGGRLIGVAKVSTGTGAVMEGSFTPMPDFAPYAALFAAREEAQNAPGADAANPADTAPSSGMNDAAFSAISMATALWRKAPCRCPAPLPSRRYASRATESALPCNTR